MVCRVEGVGSRACGRQGDVPRVGMWRAMGERYELELSDRVDWGDLPVAGVGETD